MSSDPEAVRKGQEYPSGDSGTKALCRMLPSLGELMLEPAFLSLSERHSRALVVQAGRAALGRMRRDILAGKHTAQTLTRALQNVATALSAELELQMQPCLRSVINATGVLLHTNLGRAPLGRYALDRVVEVAAGYSNLELDLSTGNRGKRDQHAEPLLLRILAAALGQPFNAIAASHGVVVVNNCAAATFLALNSLAEGGEVIVSRGELVEIGGGFRVPDILRKSGALLREVGTTNRTRIADYAAAVGDNTRLILRVHQSNFRMEGFTEMAGFDELVSLGRARGIPVFEDQGTGLLVPLDTASPRKESSFLESFQRGPDLIAASGDKLLGGPQCGLLVGRKALIEKVRTNPLLRALRVDKLTYAALEATLLLYAAHREDEVPVVRMMRATAEALRARCHHVLASIHALSFESEIIAAKSVIGGGTTPGATLDSFALHLRHRSRTASEVLSALRCQMPPLIGRVQEDRVLLDLRTVLPEQDEQLVRVLQDAARVLEA